MKYEFLIHIRLVPLIPVFLVLKFRLISGLADFWTTMFHFENGHFWPWQNGLTRIEHLKGSWFDWFLHGAPTEAVYNRLGRGANDITCILRGAMTNSTNVVVFKMFPNVQKIHFFFISNAESDSIIMIQLRNKSQTKILLRLHFSNNSTTQKNVKKEWHNWIMAISGRLRTLSNVRVHERIPSMSKLKIQIFQVNKVVRWKYLLRV